MSGVGVGLGEMDNSLFLPSKNPSHQAVMLKACLGLESGLGRRITPFHVLSKPVTSGSDAKGMSGVGVGIFFVSTAVTSDSDIKRMSGVGVGPGRRKTSCCHQNKPRGRRGGGRGGLRTRKRGTGDEGKGEWAGRIWCRGE